MVKVIIVNGRPGSGKTTFEQFCQKWHYDDEIVAIVSTVDFVKEVALTCGWDGTKTPHNRKFLSDLKDLLTQWNDIPFKKIAKRVEFYRQMEGGHFLFIDCREPEEIEKLKKAFNATTVLIRRPQQENEETSNHADANVFDYEYDVELYNEYGLAELEVMAARFINDIREEDKKWLF